MLSVLSYGCKNENTSNFQKSYVVGVEFSLPYNDSWQQINSSPLEEIMNEIRLYDKEMDYFIVDNEGNTMNNDFPQKENRTPKEYEELAQKIKDSAWKVVKKDMFFVTTAEKEIKALFEGKRKVHGKELDKVISDNEEAYKNKDYQKINDYLNSQKIKVWKSYLTD